MFDAAPEVFAHNVETVPRIFKSIRPAFRYQRSLDVITAGRDAGLVTKSNLILGMGETDEEVLEALQDLHDAGCDIITITQYLRPRRGTTRRALGQAGDVRGVLPGGRGDGLQRRHGRSARAVLLPRRRLWAGAMRKRGVAIPAHLAHLDKDTPAAQEASSLLARG